MPDFLSGFSFSLDFLLQLLSIVAIDVVLAGDNAVVIALAVRNLPPRSRTKGIAVGAGAAVVLRVALTFVAAQLLDLPFLKLAGGLLVAVIAVKLFAEGDAADKEKSCTTFLQAITTIVAADLVMSTDNILAVAGASRGNLALLIFGLGLSIPFVVFAANALSRLMDRFPIIIALGAAVLGKVAAEMILTDAWVASLARPGQTAVYAGEVVGAVGVVVVGRLWARRLARA
ncbi:TerC family protein [Desulfovibrio sp. JY]|nr:TerC family protein [Desulfovibrio sp. JY]